MIEHPDLQHYRGRSNQFFKMATNPRFRNKQPTDVWSIRERLCLASSVLRSGDQNWVSVSRAIRPFGETNRPPDWFSQKNCALQYSELLEKVETPKRKRGERSDTIDTPGDLIVRKLTLDRIEELKKVINDSQMRHKKFKRELEMVRCGQLDEKLDDLWRGIQDEIRAKEIADNEHSKWAQEREQRNAQAARMAPKGLLQASPGKNKRQKHLLELRRNSSEHSEQDSPLSEPLSVEVEETSSPIVPGIQSSSSHGEFIPTFPATSTSPLLTSLLKSPSQTMAPSQQTSRGLNPAAGEIPSPTSGLSARLGSFFNPSSALATAAARQLAVACTASGGLFPPTSNSPITSSPIKDERNSFVTSVTSSAPTLSRLLELPPSMPGKLPPLPVVEPSPPPITPTSVPLLPPLPQTNIIEHGQLGLQHSLAQAEGGKVNLLESEDSDLLVGGVEGEDDSDLSRLVQGELDQDPTGLDMDMEAIVNEIMKEDLNVEDNDDSQMTLNTPPSAPSHILEDISQEAATLSSSPVKMVEPEIMHPHFSVGMEISSSSGALPTVAQERLEVSHQAQDMDERKDSSQECTANTPEDKRRASSDACSVPGALSTVGEEKVVATISGTERIPTPLSEEVVTVHKNSPQKGLVSPSKTLDIGVITADKRVPIRFSKSNTVEITQQSEVKPESVEDEDEEEYLEEESTNPSQEEESSSLPDDEVKESAVGSEDSREAQEEELSSSHLAPQGDEEEKEEHALEEESMGSVDSKVPKAPSSVSDSIPNSPVSTPQSDDQESLRDYKVWKKAIMLIWRAAANHKYANVFLHPVTNDMAPGYHSIVYRPMDLSTIKKNIEMGAVKTTLEFQRDMMLMFQNAIMYNSSDHDVFQMAVLMQKEVMEVVQDFVATQMMVQATETKVLRGRDPRPKDSQILPNQPLQRSDSEIREEELKKKRLALLDAEPKLKKRRLKLDE